MRIEEIWRFPVKSMGGEVLEEAQVGEFGIVGDREWSIFEYSSGTTLTARRSPELLFASARVVGNELCISLPDGSEIAESDHAALSKWLSRDVQIRRAGQVDSDVPGEPGEGAGATYEAPLDFENDADWISWQGPGGAFHDTEWSRVSLVSTTTLCDWDRRRFRTNIVVDGQGEDDFVGSHLRVGVEGGVELAVFLKIPRCVMVTRAQPELDRDLEVLKTINSDRAAALAIGCRVVEPGRIALGDEVIPIVA